MHRLIALGAVVLALTGFVMMAPYIPAAPTAKVHVARGVAHVVVQWSDSVTTTVRSEVRRRGILADTTLGGAKRDTTWQTRGYVSGSLARFEDPSVVFGRTYRYAVRDSIGGVAFSGWSDSVSVTVPTRKF
jgi:hypothetical protein